MSVCISSKLHITETSHGESIYTLEISQQIPGAPTLPAPHSWLFNLYRLTTESILILFQVGAKENIMPLKTEVKA